MVLEEPSVEGDELVGTVEEASVRVPLGDIFSFEIRRVSTRRTVVVIAASFFAGIAFVIWAAAGAWVGG